MNKPRMKSNDALKAMLNENLAAGDRDDTPTMVAVKRHIAEERSKEPAADKPPGSPPALGAGKGSAPKAGRARRDDPVDQEEAREPVAMGATITADADDALQELRIELQRRGFRNPTASSVISAALLLARGQGADKLAEPFRKVLSADRRRKS